MRQPRRKGETTRSSLSEQLRSIILARDVTAYALGQAAGVDRSVITRFLKREAGLSMENFDRIAAALGLRLAEPRKPGGHKRITTGEQIDGVPAHD
jgi:hypothetical protein